MNRVAFGAFCLVLLALATGAPAQAQQGGLKIAYIDSRQVLAGMPGYAQAESTYNKEIAGFRQEVETLQNSLDSAAADFDQQSVMLSPTARATKRKDLEAQRDRLERRAAELRDKAGQRERELLEPMHTRVNEVLDGVRAEGNYAMIFDVSANSGIIVSADKSLDLTDKVVQRLKGKS
jgi:Skp family chaperone for outer membrane proteins